MIPFELDFALWEKLLLAVAFALSIAIFGRDFGARIARVRAGRSDRPRTDKPRLRLRRFVDEVVLQKKILGPRPVVVFSDPALIGEVLRHRSGQFSAAQGCATRSTRSGSVQSCPPRASAGAPSASW